MVSEQETGRKIEREREREREREGGREREEREREGERTVYQVAARREVRQTRLQHERH